MNPHADVAGRQLVNLSSCSGRFFGKIRCREPPMLWFSSPSVYAKYMLNICKFALKLDSYQKIIHRVPSVFFVRVDSPESESISMSPAAPDAAGGTGAGAGAAAPSRGCGMLRLVLSSLFNWRLRKARVDVNWRSAGASSCPDRLNHPECCA